MRTLSCHWNSICKTSNFMTIKCICVDDELLAREGLALMLSNFSKFSFEGSFGSVDEVLDNTPKDIDVIFLDIEMPRQNGFELIKQWPENLPHIVFVTAYEEYAVKAFEYDALDYILKPIDEQQFGRVIKKIERSIHEQHHVDRTQLQQKINQLQNKLNLQQAQISLKTDQGYFRINVADIIWLEAVKDHVCYHLDGKQLITRTTLKSALAELNEFDFVQVHRSYAVNQKAIVKIEKYKLSDFKITMSNSDEIRMSRRFRSNVEI